MTSPSCLSVLPWPLRILVLYQAGTSWLQFMTIHSHLPATHFYKELGSTFSVIQSYECRNAVNPSSETPAVALPWHLPLSKLKKPKSLKPIFPSYRKFSRPQTIGEAFHWTCPTPETPFLCPGAQNLAAVLHVWSNRQSVVLQWRESQMCFIRSPQTCMC